MRSETREAALDAAEVLFRRYGYRKTTVEDIAAEAGMSRATIYLHFRGKEEIALAWVARIAAERRAALEAIACSAANPVARLRRMLVERVLLSFDRASDYSESIDDLLAALRRSLLEQREESHAAEAEVFAGVIRQGQRAGALARGDPAAAARLLVLVTNALLPYSLGRRDLGDREAVAARAEGIAALALEGLRTRTAARNGARADGGNARE